MQGGDPASVRAENRLYLSDNVALFGLLCVSLGPVVYLFFFFFLMYLFHNRISLGRGPFRSERNAGL